MGAYRWFAKLEQGLVAAQEFLDSDTLFRAYSYANALWESIYDKNIPNMAQKVKGHDHSATNGGRALARGTCYVGGVGDDLLMKSTALAYGNTWLSADSAVGASTNRKTILGYHFRVYHSEQFVSGGSTPSYTNGTVDTWIQLEWLSNFTATNMPLKARIVNNTLSKTSSEFVALVSGTNSGAWFHITDIPFQAGWNNYTIELLADMASYGGGSAQTDLYLTQFSMVEVAGIAQTTSLGSYIM